MVLETMYGDARCRTFCSARTSDPSVLGRPIARRNPDGTSDERAESTPRPALKVSQASSKSY